MSVLVTSIKHIGQEGEGRVSPALSPSLGAPSLGTKVRNYPVSLSITTLPSVGAIPPPQSPKAHVADARPYLSGEAPSVRPRLYSPRYRRVLKHPKPTILRAHLRSYKERSRHLCKVMGALIPRAQRRSRYDRLTPIETFDTEILTLGSGSSSFLPRRTSQRLRPHHEIKSGRCTSSKGVQSYVYRGLRTLRDIFVPLWDKLRGCFGFDSMMKWFVSM